MKRKKILWIVAGVLVAIGLIGLTQIGSYSLISNVVGNFAVGKVAAIFIAAGGMVAAVAGGTK